MHRYLATIKKEFILLRRDRGGLLLLFLMPAVLIIVMALIQDAPFRDYQEVKIPVGFYSQDTGIINKAIVEKIGGSKIFRLDREYKSEADLRGKLQSGDPQIAIILPSNTSAFFQDQIKRFVDESVSLSGSVAAPQPVQPLVLFSPDVKKSFKASVLSGLREIFSGLTALELYKNFNSSLESDPSKSNTLPAFIQIADSKENKTPFELNSVQHNVPAWTVFGMFFIVVPLAGSVIRERDQSVYLRMKTLPGNLHGILWGKISAYLLLCCFQAIVMLGIGFYILPLFNLPTLELGSEPGALFIVVLATAFAACGYGLLTGSIFKTYHQASLFGAVSVVLLAAIGGIWVPVYIMPETLQHIAAISPLYWALSAFHKVFLLSGTFAGIFLFAFKLLIFFALCIAVSAILNARRAL